MKNIFEMIFGRKKYEEESGDIMYIVAGLGNPGRDYEWTRHNTGYEVINKMAYDHNIEMNKSKFKSVVGEGNINDRKVLLMKPLTYMNLSGEAIFEAAKFYKIPPENIIVSCDDINLPLDLIRIRTKGSAGGQNGLRNIIERLGTEEFVRVRVGVGNKPDGWELKNFVLSRFTKDEDPLIISGITKAVSAIEQILKDNGDVEKAMCLYNKKSGKQ